MEREKMVQEIKYAIDFLRDHDPRFIIVGEDILKRQIDLIIDKHISKYFPEGYVLVSQKEYEDYLKNRERTKADLLSDLSETLNALENMEYPKKDRLCIFEPNGLAAYVDIQINKAKAQKQEEIFARKDVKQFPYKLGTPYWTIEDKVDGGKIVLHHFVCGYKFDRNDIYVLDDDIDGSPVETNIDDIFLTEEMAEATLKDVDHE